MKKINPIEISENAIKLISQDWMLISAGTDKKFNTMTANWGGLGFVWNKPVVYVFIRPERYTYEFVEAADEFTLSFFPDKFKKTLGMLGRVSGRDTDKIADSGLHPYFTEAGNPAFEEATLVMECKKLFKSRLEADEFIEKDILDQWYTTKGQRHFLYIAEIKNVWIKKSEED